MSNDMSDIMKNFEKERKERAEKNRGYLKQLVADLKKKGIVLAETKYDGCGDSGQIEEVRLFNKKGETEDQDLRDKVEEAMGQALEDKHGGWEINDGSFGTIVLDVAKRSLTIQHNMRYTDYTESSDEIAI